MKKISQKRLGELCKIIDCEHKTAPTQPEGIPLIRTPNIGQGRLILDNVQRISESTFSIWSRRAEPTPGDLIMAREAPVGNVAIILPGQRVCLGQRTVLIRVTSDELDPRFLNYLLNSPTLKGQVILMSIGATVGHLNVTDIRKLDLPPLPSLQVQRKIAAILTAYDDLIETNKRRIDLLEKMAEEIYREWFVRLRFPGYQNTQFIKGIPEGWEIARVDSLGKVVTGKTPSTSIARYYNGQYPFIKTPDMHGNMFILETSESLSDDGIQSQASQTIPKGSLCVSCIGTGGIVSITTERSQTNQQINSICLKRLEDLEWGYFVLQGLKETIQLFGSTGTTMTNLSKGKFSGLKFFSPPIELRNNFHSYVEAFFSEIQVLATTNRNLTKTRDLLLPRLISGKLPVEHLDIQTPPSMNP
jgi:type I restriction enzyme S subunit